MELIDCSMFLKKKKGSRDLENDRKSVRQNLDVEHKANFSGSKVNQDKMAWPRPNGESTGEGVCMPVEGGWVHHGKGMM